MLDDVVSAFDLATVEGLGRFMSMQWLALGALDGVSDDAACAPLIRELRLAAGLDLDSLGAPRPGPAPSLPVQPHPLAIDYLIAGSRLGTTILKQRWSAARNPQVMGASAYFSLPDHLEYWRAFRAVASAIDGDGPEVRRIVQDVNILFDFYVLCTSLPCR